ncbi:O-antigen translocase [uncultured Paracoccus sp.]|uniref:O-antigen translocase n=1 Tax=uncultured Paracoccus sp. TaxID=189685 RepID=UPI0026152B97|nr:O-antigen translocase [uncultured Paracoccus sp.]
MADASVADMRRGSGHLAELPPNAVSDDMGVRHSDESYREIVRSSAVVAGASIVTIAAGMVRVKAFALLLGPAGVGVFGIYSAFIDVAASACGLGIASSGVRQIADADGAGDLRRVARTASLVRRLSLALGILAVVGFIIGAGPLARFSFGDAAQESAVALLGVAVLFRILGAGEGSLLQGQRQIGALAKATIAAALVGTVASIALVLTLGIRGVVPALLVIAAAGAGANFAYSRKLTPHLRSSVAMGARGDVVDLVTLGFAFMVSGILALGAAYLVRIIVLRHGGIEAAGLYQAAWTLGGLYVGILLQAMGTDFYPRLTAIHRDGAAASALINEQMRISMLLGGPGIAATITFAPLAMTLFYSSEFVAAAEALRWICAGMAMRIVSWPMGFILLARGMRRTFMLVDVVAFSVQVALAQLLVPMIGLVGAGMAFFGMYLVHAPFVYAIARRACGVTLSVLNLILAGGYLVIVLVLLLAFTWLHPLVAMAMGSVAAAVSGVLATRDLLRLFPSAARWPARLRSRARLRRVRRMD